MLGIVPGAICPVHVCCPKRRRADGQTARLRPIATTVGCAQHLFSGPALAVSRVAAYPWTGLCENKSPEHPGKRGGNEEKQATSNEDSGTTDSKMVMGFFVVDGLLNPQNPL